uniref:RING-type E3 ubiquitin transferase n=1 Tax=Onchocerca volvulus TaxID=6282 RepID=A0A8R1TJB1_ONCVO
MSELKVAAKRSNYTADRELIILLSRRNMIGHFGRGRGRVERMYQRDGPSRSGFHKTSSGRDGHDPKSRKYVTRDPKYYERLFVGTSNRSDHAGIKFRGESTECDICCRESDLFAIGPCLHPICIECGIRLRILCGNETCPKCRTVIDVLYFVPFPGDWSNYQIPLQCVEHKDAVKHKIKLADEYVAKCYENYLSHQCLLCEKKGEKRVFETFAQLNQHVYMVHRFEFCDICVENLNLFTYERKFYSHLDLERHLEYGDSDDKSFKGHPQCLFCEKRFLDEEFRYRHLRKEHFFCQICDADGRSNYFFSEHKDLLSHYRAKHIICEEGECLHLGIAFRTDTELKLHKSRDHAAGPQILNLDFHFSDRNSAGPSRGGRITHSARSTFSSKQNIPKIGVIPHEQPSRENKPAVHKNNISTVSSAESELTGSSFPNCFSQFTLQGSDFPRLDKSTRISEASNLVSSSQDNKSVAKPQEVTNANNVKVASNSNEPNAVSSRSWFIDDDEQFPPPRTHLSTLSKVQTENGNTENFVTDKVEIESSSRISAIESSWSKTMKKPMSLSNVASALALSDFPKLPESSVTKSVNNLLPGSVWAKKNRSVMQAPPRQLNLSSAASVTRNISGKNKQLPQPDLWPRESVPEKWEDAEDSSVMGSLPKMTLKDIVIIKDTPSKKKEGKKNKNKQQNNSTKKQNEQLSEGKKREVEDKTIDEFVDPFPSLSCHTHHENEAEESSITKPAFSLSKLLSSTFSVLNSMTIKEDKNEHAETNATNSVNESTIDISSSKAFPELGEGSEGKVFRKQAEIIEKHPYDLGSPPGLCLDLAPPPGFGPPPGFDNTAFSEVQVSSSTAIKSSDESVEVNVSKEVKHGNKKKDKK